MEFTLEFLRIFFLDLCLLFTGMIVAVALHAANYSYGQVYDASGFRDRQGAS
jgi:hypothetical protein